MTDEQSTDYFLRRAAEEQDAADNAADERSASLHRQLAAHYRKCADDCAPPAPEEEQSPAGTLHAEFQIL